MQDVLTCLRTLQFVAHNGHNNVSGDTFFSDHSFLGDLYEAYEGAYDSVVERAIGEAVSVDLLKAGIDAADGARPVSDDPKKIFSRLLKMEADLRKDIDDVIKEQSEGTQNLLQGIADDSLERSYKLGKRLGK
jgi:DNA-binding ferritin-like protein